MISGQVVPGRAATAELDLSRFGPIGLVVVQSTSLCNLDCDYCFFLSKETLYPGSPFRMTP